MKLVPDSPLLQSPSMYPVHSLLKKVLNLMASVSQATYTDFVTGTGNTIRIINEMSLGEILNFIAAMLLLASIIFFFFSRKIWSEKK